MLTTLASAPSDRPIIVLYVRLSREEQAQGHGQERQLDVLVAWCRKEGVSGTVLLQDVGFSAYVGEHIQKGEMGRFIAALDGGRIAPGSTLVLENLDRLSRENPFRALAIFSGILTQGVAIVTAADGVRFTQDGSSMQRLTTIITGMMGLARGNNESETKSGRVSSVWKNKIAKAREAGIPHGNRCPAWIRLVDGKYELIDTRAREVVRMFDLTIAGRGRRQIIDDLKARDVEPWTKASTKRISPAWSDSYVQKILSGGEAYGEYRPHLSPQGQPKVALEPIPGYYPAAVDQWTAERARAASASRQGGGGRKGAFKNLFQGLCVCAACGKGMTIEDKGLRSSGPKLVCQRSTLKGCDHRFRYDYQIAELSVIFVIRQHADELLRSSRSLNIALTDRIADQTRLLADARARMERIARQMELDDDDDGTLARRYRAIRDERRKFEAEIGRLSREKAGAREMTDGQSPHAMMAFYERLKAIPEDERPQARNAINQGLRSILKRIVFRDGLLDIELHSGGVGKADLRAGALPRPNPGQFAGGLDASGKQVRKRVSRAADSGR